MNKTFIVSKELLDFAFHVNSTIEVKPLPNDRISQQTIELLVLAHQARINYYRISKRHDDLIDVAIQYFKDNGLEVREEQKQ